MAKRRRKVRPPRINTSTAPGSPAYRLGLTGSGYANYKLGHVPLAMAERSPGGIERATRKMLNKAYRPVLNELNSQEARLAGIRAKRESDSRAYQVWLANRQDALRSEAMAADVAIQERTRTAQTDLANQQTMVREGMANQLQRLGVGSTPGGAAAEQIAASGQAGLTSAAAQGSAVQAKSDVNTATLRAQQANDQAFLAAQQAKDFANSLEEFKSVADAKQKVRFAQAQDYARQIAHLLDTEVAKAQSNREFSAALEKLNIDAAEVRAKARKDAFDINEKNRRFELDFSKYELELDKEANAEKNRIRDDRRAAAEKGDPKKMAAEDKKLVRSVNGWKTRLFNVMGSVKEARKERDKALKRLTRLRRQAQKAGQSAEFQYAYSLWYAGHLRPQDRNDLKASGFPIPKGW